MKKRTLRRILTMLLTVLAAVVFLTGAVSADTPSAIYSADELFSSRDLAQEADLSEAVSLTVSDGEDIHITEAGIYVLSGTASGVTIRVEAGTDDKVQLVLNGLSITNTDFPAVYVTEADKVFITTSADSSLSVTGAFRTDGSVNTDGVIFSKTDLVLNGTATLTITSPDNGIVSKDDIKITGGTYTVTASSKCIEANDSIRIADGVLVLNAGTDGLHAENDEDDSLGYIYIGDGTLEIRAGDDGIHATSVLQIDGGAINISAKEGFEATYIQVNGGTINISAADDGINAGAKSRSLTPTVEINAGDVTVSVSAGDTDGIDSNGNIVINGGTVSVTGNSTFDYDSTGIINGGTVYVNGTLYTSSTLPNQMMGGGRGGWGGQGGWGNPGDQGGFGGHGGWGGPGGQGGGRHH